MRKKAARKRASVNAATKNSENSIPFLQLRERIPELFARYHKEMLREAERISPRDAVLRSTHSCDYTASDLLSQTWEHLLHLCNLEEQNRNIAKRKPQEPIENFRGFMATVLHHCRDNAYRKLMRHENLWAKRVQTFAPHAEEDSSLSTGGMSVQHVHEDTEIPKKTSRKSASRKCTKRGKRDTGRSDGSARNKPGGQSYV